MTISEAKRQARITEWVQNIREQQDSGFTVKSWCAAHGCKEGRYYYWLRIIRSAALERAQQAEQVAALIRVEPEQLPYSALAQPVGEDHEQPGVTVRYGKATVTFPVGTSTAAIAELLKSLHTT